ncbi:hypothetical protein R1sor_015823 [Riccia sorocarpa]|uniref:Uncharacterized protein n=1 Tax=Riccia sorocarpa TaxID=122646 RepID=A0ABD3HHA3_9MARC
MNMVDASPESQDDPYLKQWQSEQLESKSRKNRQSWSQWATKLKDNTRLWIDRRLTPKRKQVSPEGGDGVKWKVIHDNDDENEGPDHRILPPAQKRTKIKYGESTVDEEGDRQEGEGANTESASVAVTGGIEDVRNEFLSKRGANSDEQIIDASKEAGSKSEEKYQESGQAPELNLVDKTKPPTRPPPPPSNKTSTTRNYHHLPSQGGTRDVVTNNTSNNSSSASGKGVPPTVGSVEGAVEEVGVGTTVVGMAAVQDNATSHATPKLSTTLRRDDSASQQHPAAASSKSDDSLPVSSARSIGRMNFSRESGSKSNHVSPRKRRNPMGSSSVGSSPEKALQQELPAVVSRGSTGTPTPPRTPPMNEKVAQARMRKPEPVTTATHTVPSNGVNGGVRDEQFLFPLEGLATAGKTGTRNREQSSPSSSSGESELSRSRKDGGGAHDGPVRLSKNISSESTNLNPAVVVDSFDESEVADRSEKVIFVDESSELKSNYAASSNDHRFTTDGVCLDADDSVKRRGSDVEGLSVSPDKERKPEGQSATKVDVSSLNLSASLRSSMASDEGCEKGAGISSVDNVHDVQTASNDAKQQKYNLCSEKENSNLVSSQSIDGIASVTVRERDSENISPAETSEGGSSVVEGLGSGADQLQNVQTEGVPTENIEGAVSRSDENSFPVDLAQKGSRGGSSSGKDEADAQNLSGDQNDDTRSSSLLKKSTSMPTASRVQVRERSTLAKANTFAERNLHQSDSDSDTEGALGIKRASERRKISLDSVEEITARLSKKYSSTWTKVQQQQTKESPEPSRSKTDTPVEKPADTPEIFPLQRRGSESQPTDSYMASMKKVLSAVKSSRNREKEVLGKNGQGQIVPEKKGLVSLASVLSIKRERFTSPLRRAGAGSSGKKKEKEKERVGDETGFVALAEEEGKRSADKFRDRLMKAFSSEARTSSSSSSAKKPDTPSRDFTPAASPGSSSAYNRSTETEAVADGRFSRGRFTLPLKRFSWDRGEERYSFNDSAASTSETPDRSGPLTRDPADEKQKSKSPDRKFSFHWNKKRQKDDDTQSQKARESVPSPSSIFQKPRSPGISEQTAARLRSPVIDVADDDTASCFGDELPSQERKLFRSLSKRRDKKKELSSLLAAESSKEKVKGGKPSSYSSWWTRKRDKVTVEEATIAVQEDDQTTRQYAKLSPQEVAAVRDDSGFKRSPEKTTATSTNSPSATSTLGVATSHSVERIPNPITPSTSEKKTDKRETPYPVSVRSRVNEEMGSPATAQRLDFSKSIRIKTQGHQRRMSLPEFDTPEADSALTSGEEINPLEQKNPNSVGRSSSYDWRTSTAWNGQHSRHKSSDVIDMFAGRRSDIQEQVSPFEGSSSNPKVKELYRNLDFQTPSSNVEIRITDKFKVPLEEVLSLLAVGDSSSSVRNSTVAAVESSSAEETSSSEEDWSSSDDEQVEESREGEEEEAEELSVSMDRVKKSWALHQRAYLLGLSIRF